MATKREKVERNNRIVRGLGLVGSFLLLSASWVRIALQDPLWSDWFGFVLGTLLFFYCLAATIKDRRVRRQKRTMNGRS